MEKVYSVCVCGGGGWKMSSWRINTHDLPLKCMKIACDVIRVEMTMTFLLKLTVGNRLLFNFQMNQAVTQQRQRELLLTRDLQELVSG